MKKDELIEKWLKNELSEAENKAFQQLEDADFNTYIVDYAKHFKASDHSKLSDFNSFKERYNKQKTPVRKIDWFNPFIKVASVIIVTLGLYFTFFFNQETRIETLANENRTVTLPDNSIVKVNELSQLVFSEQNWDNNRTLDLDGEAFFDVEKGNRFDVNTANGKVSVLGTEFNVVSRDSVFKVSCYEGLVQVTYNNNDVKLPAGTEFSLKSGQGSKTTIAIVEPYWLKNMSVFENATLTDVVKELEKHFDINVQYPTDLTTNFTGAFEHGNLQNALKSITKPLDLTYTIKNSKVVIARHE
ncbi:FecR family protein [Winogradskyella aquimaris]|uniref:FecR family protein n=1 Tax=Winogradskyella aquimaris TaxID=864074 RepID=A0ABU5EMS9_9FLAO|nr:FecR family protein [Winogradskyella aquimaris]MDY2587374.1 FecR family protein [Winogradskyella aquimaris]